MHMLVRHKVADFAKWKPVYDAHLSARQKAGLKEEHLFRNADDPNEVLLLFSMEDLDKAKAFTASDDLRQAMEKSGVSDKPDVYFLKKEKGAELTIDTKWTILSRHFRQQSLNFIHIPSTETDFNLKE